MERYHCWFVYYYLVFLVLLLPVPDSDSIRLLSGVLEDCLRSLRSTAEKSSSEQSRDRTATAVIRVDYPMGIKVVVVEYVLCRHVGVHTGQHTEYVLICLHIYSCTLYVNYIILLHCAHYFIHICTYLYVLCTYSNKVISPMDSAPIALLLGRLVRGGLSLLSPHRESPLALSSGGVANAWSWYHL